MNVGTLTEGENLFELWKTLFDVECVMCSSTYFMLFLLSFVAIYGHWWWGDHFETVVVRVANFWNRCEGVAQNLYLDENPVIIIHLFNLFFLGSIVK